MAAIVQLDSELLDEHQSYHGPCPAEATRGRGETMHMVEVGPGETVTCTHCGAEISGVWVRPRRGEAYMSLTFRRGNAND